MKVWLALSLLVLVVAAQVAEDTVTPKLDERKKPDKATFDDPIGNQHVRLEGTWSHNDKTIAQVNGVLLRGVLPEEKTILGHGIFEITPVSQDEKSAIRSRDSSAEDASIFHLYCSETPKKLSAYFVPLRSPDAAAKCYTQSFKRKDIEMSDWSSSQSDDCDGELYTRTVNVPASAFQKSKKSKDKEESGSSSKATEDFTMEQRVCLNDQKKLEYFEEEFNIGSDKMKMRLDAVSHLERLDMNDDDTLEAFEVPQICRIRGRKVRDPKQFLSNLARDLGLQISKKDEVTETDSDLDDRYKLKDRYDNSDDLDERYQPRTDKYDVDKYAEDEVQPTRYYGGFYGRPYWGRGFHGRGFGRGFYGRPYFRGGFGRRYPRRWW